METIPYSIVCEDVAHYFFVKQVLLLHSTAALQFEINENCFLQYRCKNKKEVLDGYVDIANQAFRQYQIELLIIMTDPDDRPKESFSEFHNELSNKLWDQIRHQVIIAIPVRCIEHWLRFLQWKKENPKSTKNESMEDEIRSESKLKVYGSKKPSKDRTESVVKDLVAADHIKWLTQRSMSFNHFYIQLTSFSAE
jgi:hypothetical protein